MGTTTALDIEATYTADTGAGENWAEEATAAWLTAAHAAGLEDLALESQEAGDVNTEAAIVTDGHDVYVLVCGKRGVDVVHAEATLDPRDLLDGPRPAA